MHNLIERSNGSNSTLLFHQTQLVVTNEHLISSVMPTRTTFDRAYYTKLIGFLTGCIFSLRHWFLSLAL